MSLLDLSHSPGITLLEEEQRGPGVYCMMHAHTKHRIYANATSFGAKKSFPFEELRRRRRRVEFGDIGGVPSSCPLLPFRLALALALLSNSPFLTPFQLLQSPPPPHHFAPFFPN
jgi:hypothetical protein